MPHPPLGANTGHLELMLRLKQQHQPLLDLIGQAPVQYLDIPVHENIGDLLIYLGTLALLKNNGIPLILEAPNFRHYPPKDLKGILLLHGGGNVGDLYPDFQQFRERVIQSNLERRIVILPQSIHFQSNTNFERARRIFATHPDLHLCVRDEKSRNIARQLCANVLLLPDMAHQLYPLRQAQPATGGILQVMRQDKEKATTGQPDNDSNHAPTLDWPMLDSYPKQRAVRRILRIADTLHRLHLEPLAGRFFAAWWKREAARRVDEAIDLFASHRHIVTDRLHAHILACLMDIPNTVLDNSYGKNSSYLQAWTASSPLVETRIQ